MQRSLIAFACAVLAAVPAASADAQARVTTQIRVTSAGLDLATPAGAQIMLGRLQRASVRACGDRPLTAPMETGAVRRFQRCRRATLGKAVADLDAPLVTGLLELRSGKTRQLASR